MKKKNSIFLKWEFSTSIFLPCFFLPSFPPSHVCCYHISGTDGDISACFLWNFRTVGKIDLMSACITGVRLQLWYVPPGGVLGTPSTWSLDPSWDDGDRGGIPEEVTADGRSKCYQSEGSQGEHVPSRKTSSWKVRTWKGVCYFLCFWGNEKPEGLENESKDGMVQNVTGHLCGVRSFMGHKSFSLWLKSTSKIFSRNLARLELERCFHINVWKAYWSWVMEEMGRLVWRLLSRQRWFCLEVEWWQWGWTTMGWRHSGGKTNSTRQWGGCRKVSRMGLRFRSHRAIWYHWVEEGI